MKYKIIFRFPVMWRGWECHEVGYVAVTEKGEKFLIMGGQEATQKDYEDKIKEYEWAIKLTKQALDICNDGKVYEPIEVYDKYGHELPFEEF